MGRAAVVIPARHASTRYPGKPLVELRGANGTYRSLLARSIDAARQGVGGLPIWVATDHAEIAAEAQAQDAQVAMTPTHCRNGTERVAAALPAVGEVDFVVNFQGDALLTPPHYVAALVAHMAASDTPVATVAMRCTPTMLAHLLADRAAGRVGGTTVVVDRASRALYFSKHVLPFGALDATTTPVLVHLGLYAYRPASLAAYVAASETAAERSEGLEQLRFLDIGMPMTVVVVEPAGWDPVELNNPGDVPIIEAILAARDVG